MKRSAKKLIVTLVVLIGIAACLLYYTADRLAIWVISQHCNAHITYRHIDNNGFRTFNFTDLVVNDNKTGIGILAKKAAIKPLWRDILTGAMGLSFTLSDVSFIKREDEKRDDYETFEGLAAIPFSSQWTYRDVTGALQTANGNVHLQDLKATGDLLKFAITSDFHNDANIESDITIYFSDSLLAKIPKKLIKGVLKEEGDGWQSFSIKRRGNYKDPSIQVTGKQFRLNIGYSPS